MPRTFSVLLIAVAALAAYLTPMTAFADPMDQPLEVDRGINPTQRARELYQANLDQAERALRNNLAQCDKMQPSDRAECIREARDLHDDDVAKASDVLHRPR